MKKAFLDWAKQAWLGEIAETIATADSGAQRFICATQHIPTGLAAQGDICNSHDAAKQTALWKLLTGPLASDPCDFIENCADGASTVVLLLKERFKSVFEILLEKKQDATSLTFILRFRWHALGPTNSANFERSTTEKSVGFAAIEEAVCTDFLASFGAICAHQVVHDPSTSTTATTEAFPHEQFAHYLPKIVTSLKISQSLTEVFDLRSVVSTWAKVCFLGPVKLTNVPKDGPQRFVSTAAHEATKLSATSPRSLRTIADADQAALWELIDGPLRRLTWTEFSTFHFSSATHICKHFESYLAPYYNLTFTTTPRQLGPIATVNSFITTFEVKTPNGGLITATTNRRYQTKEGATEAAALGLILKLSSFFTTEYLNDKDKISAGIKRTISHYLFEVYRAMIGEYCFYRGQQVDFDETEDREFKGKREIGLTMTYAEMRSKYIAGKKLAGRYLSAFLNKRPPGVCRLYLGIHDSGLVQGLAATADERDDAQLIFFGMRKWIDPQPGPGMVQLRFIPVVQLEPTEELQQLRAKDPHARQETLEEIIKLRQQLNLVAKSDLFVAVIITDNTSTPDVLYKWKGEAYLRLDNSVTTSPVLK